MINQFGATAFHGFIFETVVITIISAMTIMALGKYFQKGRNKPALFLFMVFLNWTLAVFFSYLAKIFSAFTNLDDIDITDAGSYFIRLVLDFRLLFVFVSIALYCSYMLRVMLFEKKYKAGERTVNTIFLVLIPVLCFVLVEKDNMLYTIIIFLVVFVYMLVVYTRFLSHAMDSYKTANEKYKGAFKALSLQALFFILTFLFFLLDQVMIPIQEALGETASGFTIFYFAAWTCAVVGIVLTYYGYIKPRA